MVRNTEDHPHPPQDRENHYEIWNVDSRTKLGEHTFRNSSNEDIALPSAKYFAVHAAFARVFHASGAGEYFESLFEDSEDIAIFASDGSTDVSALLRYKLAALLVGVV